MDRSLRLHLAVFVPAGPDDDVEVAVPIDIPEREPLAVGTADLPTLPVEWILLLPDQNAITIVVPGEIICGSENRMSSPHVLQAIRWLVGTMLVFSSAVWISIYFYGRTTT